MNTNQLLEETFKEMDGDFERALQGLTPHELAWRPSPEANSIGFTFWHLTRAEDIWVNDFARKVPQVFARDGWASKWGVPPGDTGAGYDKAKLTQFKNPPIEELWQYNRTVRQETLRYLKGLAAKDFDVAPPTDNPRRQGYTVGRMFGHILCEVSQHLGHVRYIRGLQRGINS